MGALGARRVVELASEATAFAGKLLADMGADVIVVEPPGGSTQRRFGPFLGDEAGIERSLYWWHYNTSKRSVVLDITDTSAGGGRDTLLALLAEADVFLEGERPGRLAELRLDYHDTRAARSDLIHCSVTPFGRSGPRCDEHATDLTILAAGGPVWSCGYDDHEIPPVRGGGNQGLQTGGVWAVIAILTALLHRGQTGVGQHLDVSQHAASNVTTELGSYAYLVAGREVQRQTGRHASHQPTEATQVPCADGRWLNVVVPPRRPAEFKIVREWLVELGLAEQFPMTALLEKGGAYEHIGLAEIEENPEIGEVFEAGRAAVALIASKLPALEAFLGFQRRGLPVGAILAPEEVIENPHFIERGFVVDVEHDDLGRSFAYPGAPIRMNGSPSRISRRAPHVGEHTDEVLGALRAAPAGARRAPKGP
jgi:crotonobetainyl-CoA:carnitine CoA-transferase CaiB-like acyl-CoA transferase